MSKQCDHRRVRQGIDGVGPLYDIGFHSGPFSRQPVHEHMTIAALIRSKVAFPKNTAYNNLTDEQWEFIRGLIWNDDPSCLLFVDDSVNNHKWGWGLEWLRAYENSRGNSMTRRSHWGDLQFLHCMAGEDGEGPYLTRRNLMNWFEVMYKLACGHMSPQTKLGEVFPLLFNDSTVPSADQSLQDLLIATTPNYKDFNLHHRAIGSCVHMIQDSYAIGHTQRRLLNPEDRVDDDSQGFIEFRPGTYGLWGPIICFHNYASQTGNGHTHYDGMEGATPDPEDLDSFNQITGARNAIAHCIRLLNFFAASMKWEDGVREYLREQVFVLDEDAKRSDGSTEPDDGSEDDAAAQSAPRPESRGAQQRPRVRVDANSQDPTARDEDLDYEKLPLLESARELNVRSEGGYCSGRSSVFAIVLLLYCLRVWLWWRQGTLW